MISLDMLTYLYLLIKLVKSRFFRIYIIEVETQLEKTIKVTISDSKVSIIQGMTKGIC